MKSRTIPVLCTSSWESHVQWSQILRTRESTVYIFKNNRPITAREERKNNELIEIRKFSRESKKSEKQSKTNRAPAAAEQNQINFLFEVR